LNIGTGARPRKEKWVFFIPVVGETGAQVKAQHQQRRKN
jgi:hypothetical protein